MPEMRLVSLSEIDFTPGLDNLVQELDSGAIIQNNILLIRYHGISLHNFLKLSPLESIINLKEVIGNFAFNLWIGNYDRKDDDYSVDSRRYREFLRERRDGLRSAIRLWCSHGYPKGHRMQEQY
ncbi:MAG TPA: hypothetical protein PK587_07140 [Syntrophales bacterium]|nr:hypothetical protein [Syntrophales bacterium]HPL63524.1 hypothetical protein [Syntrophales bacterium]